MFTSRVGRDLTKLGCRAIALAVGVTAAGLANSAFAGGGVQVKQVKSGTATFRQNGSLTQIRASDRAIVDYGRFDIPNGSTVQFIQPSSSSSVLNRIDSSKPSLIDGKLQANGIIYFMNPAGILFGPNAVVDVGGIYAAAAHMSDQDFQNNINQFHTTGAVQNNGHITADEVYLVGRVVTNNGAINAPQGTVAMIAGNDVLIGQQNGHIFVKLDPSLAVQAGTTPLGGVENAGNIQAPKGSVVIGAGDMYSLAMRRTSNVTAKQVTVQAGKGSNVVVSGSIDASDKSTGGVGGHVEILGDSVVLVDANIDASGDAGGGEVLIGGNFQGKGPQPNAENTSVSADSIIRADALTLGNGGKVVVWADGSTNFDGTILARGGTMGGSGGSAEVSGKQSLEFTGWVDLSAKAGLTGTLLLDPGVLNVEAGAADSGTDDSQLNVDTPNPGDPAGEILGPDGGPGANFTITAAKVVAELDATDVRLQANNAINVDAAIDAQNNLNAHNLTLDAPAINLSADVSTNGAQYYLNAAVLKNNVTLTTTGSGVTFNNTVNGNTSGGQSLTIVGDATFRGIVGGGTKLKSLSVNNGGASTFSTSAINTTGGDQTYTGPVVLTSSATLTATGGGITFGNTVKGNSSNAQDLTINAAATTFNGNVGGGTALGNLTIHSDAIIFPAAINTGTSVVLSTQTASKSIGVNSSTASPDINFDVANLGGIITTQLLKFGDPSHSGAIIIGNDSSITLPANTNLAFVTNGAGGISLRNDVSTSGTGGQSYNGPVTLGADTTLTGNGVTFNNTVNGTTNGGQALTIAGNATFDGIVGGVAKLKSLSVSGSSAINTSTINTASGGIGDQTYTGPVVLTADTTLTTATGGGFIFGDTINGTSNGGQALNVMGDATFGGIVGGVTKLKSLSVSGASTFSTSAINTTNAGGGSGNQTYTGPVVLTTSSTLTATGGAVNFGTTVDGTNIGGESLTISGNAVFGGTVGGGTNLSSLSVSGTSAINGGSVTSTGDQTYTGAATLGADTTLTGSGTNSNIAFGSTVDSQANKLWTLIVNAPGLTWFKGRVGSVANGQLGELMMINAAGSTEFGNLTPISINTSPDNTLLHMTSGDQTYSNPVTLGNDATLTSNGTNSNITFSSTVDGLHALTVNTRGQTFFEQAVGSGTNLLSLTTDAAPFVAGGTTNIDGGSVTSTGNQTYNDAVLLGADTTLTGSGTNSNITFGSTVDSQFGKFWTLTANAPGLTWFKGSVGSVINGQLGELVTDAAGTTQLGASTLNAITIKTVPDTTLLHITNGDQTYNDAVILGNDATLASNGTNSNITFSSTVDGLHALTVNTRGQTFFEQAVGSGTNLLSLTTDAAPFVAGGTTNIDGGSVTSTGKQTYNDAVILGTDATLTGTGVTFNDTVNGVALTVKGSSAINGGSVTTAGNQTYNGEVTLGTDTTLVGNAVKFSNSVTGHGKTLVVMGNTTLGSGSNGAVNLDYLGVGGKTFFDGLRITTTSDQKYDGTVQLIKDVTLTGRTVELTGNIDGHQNLTIDVGNAVIFGGDVGNGTRLKSIQLIGNAGSEEAFTAYRDTGNATLGTAIFKADTFTMGANDTSPTSPQHWALGVVGNLTIDATNKAVLGDLAASGNIDVIAKTIQMNLRALAKGENQTHIVGYVAGGQLTFSTMPINQEGLPTIFGDSDSKVPNVHALQVAANHYSPEDMKAVIIDAQPDFAQVPQFPTTPPSSPITATLTKYDAKDGLSGETELTQAIAIVIPREDPKPLQEVSILASQKEELQKMGIYARDFVENKEAFVAYVERPDIFKTFPDVPEKTNPQPDEFKVTTDRFSQGVVKDALDTYISIYFETSKDAKGHTVRGAARSGKIRADLQQAVDAYKQQNNNPATLDPAAFRKFVDTVGNEGARDYLTRMTQLYHQIDIIGLGPGESRGVRDALLGDVVPRSSVDFLYQVIRAYPMARKTVGKH